jgi:hypothetical protein
MPKFEIAVHNEDVHKLENAGEHHRNLSKDWADTHYFEIEARGEAHVQSVALTKYPISTGYMIERISEV